MMEVKFLRLLLIQAPFVLGAYEDDGGLPDFDLLLIDDEEKDRVDKKKTNKLLKVPKNYDDDDDDDMIDSPEEEEEEADEEGGEETRDHAFKVPRGPARRSIKRKKPRNPVGKCTISGFCWKLTWEMLRRDKNNIIERRNKPERPKHICATMKGVTEAQCERHAAAGRTRCLPVQDEDGPEEGRSGQQELAIFESSGGLQKWAITHKWNEESLPQERSSKRHHTSFLKEKN